MRWPKDFLLCRSFVRKPVVLRLSAGTARANQSCAESLHQFSSRSPLAVQTHSQIPCGSVSRAAGDEHDGANEVFDEPLARGPKAHPRKVARIQIHETGPAGVALARDRIALVFAPAHAHAE